MSAPHKSWVTLALDKHTSRSSDKTLESLQQWLNRDIAGWQVALLLQLRGSTMDAETARAISEIGIEPEDSPEAVGLHKHGPFHTLYHDGSPTGSYEWSTFDDLAGRRVLVTDGVDANEAHEIWESDDDAAIIDTTETLAYRLRDTFETWEEL